MPQSQYTGKFVTGVKHGHGRYISSINTNHKVLEGEWENDTLHGKTIEQWEVALESFVSKIQALETCERSLHQKQTAIHSIQQDDMNQGAKDPLALN